MVGCFAGLFPDAGLKGVKPEPVPAAPTTIEMFDAAWELNKALNSSELEIAANSAVAFEPKLFAKAISWGDKFAIIAPLSK
jgi:hypothetical protein